MEKFERVKLLGRGSFGRAWLIKEVSSQRLLVAKEIRVENKHDLEDAISEARIMERVDHVNIVKFHEVHRVSAHTVTIVMEYCDDGDIAEKIGRRKHAQHYFDEEQVLRWLAQLVHALIHLHARGMIHRDLKTANLFCCSDGTLKLGDFGVAKILERNAARMSARTTRTPVGTPMYMSPELCAGLPYTQKADVWALGCILYEMCALRPAFIAQNIDMLMAKIQRGQHDRSLPRHYSCDTAELIEALLCVDPAARMGLADLQRLPYLAPFFADAPLTRIARGLPAPPAAPAAPVLPPAPPEIVIFANTTRRRSSAGIRLRPLDDGASPHGSPHLVSSPDISSPGSASPTSMHDHDPATSDPGLPRSPLIAARRHVSPQHAQARRSSERDRERERRGGEGAGAGQSQNSLRGMEKQSSISPTHERAGLDRERALRVSLPQEDIDDPRSGHHSPRVTLTPSPTSSDQRTAEPAETASRAEDGRVEILRRERRGSRSSSLSPTPRRASEARPDVPLLPASERRMSLQPLVLEEAVRDPRVGSSGRLSPLTPLGPIPHTAHPSSPLVQHSPLVHGHGSTPALLSPSSPYANSTTSPFAGLGSGSDTPHAHACGQTQSSSPGSPSLPCASSPPLASPLSGPTITLPGPTSDTPPKAATSTIGSTVGGATPPPLTSGPGSSSSLSVVSAHTHGSRSASPEPPAPARRRSSLVPRAVSPQIRLPPVRLA